MQEIIQAFILLALAIKLWLLANADSILVGIVTSIIFGLLVKTGHFFFTKPKELYELLQENNYNNLGKR